MLKRKIIKTGIGLLLLLSLFSVSISSTVSAAKKCKHSYVGEYCCSSVRGQYTHQFYNAKTITWDNCVRKYITDCYVYRCKKCDEYAEGIGYTKERFTHSNTLCPLYPKEK